MTNQNLIKETLRNERVWAFRLIKQMRKKIKLITVKNKKKALAMLIKQFAYSKSIVHTDCWKGYIEFYKYFKHYTVNHYLPKKAYL